MELIGIGNSPSMGATSDPEVSGVAPEERGKYEQFYRTERFPLTTTGTWSAEKGTRPAGTSSRFPYRRTYQHIRSRRRRCPNGLHLFIHSISTHLPNHTP